MSAKSDGRNTLIRIETQLIRVKTELSENEKNPLEQTFLLVSGKKQIRVDALLLSQNKQNQTILQVPQSCLVEVTSLALS